MDQVDENDGMLCKLCFEDITGKQFHVIGEDFLKAAAFLSLNMSLNERENLNYMCNDCSEKVFAAFNFKRICLDTENSLVPYIDSGKALQVDLKDIYLKVKGRGNVTVTSDQQVCRLCMCIVNDEFKSLTELCDENMVVKYIQEVNFRITKDPVVCKQCSHSLDVYIDCLRKWRDIEKIIKIEAKDIDDDICIKSEEVDLKFETPKDGGISLHGSNEGMLNGSSTSTNPRSRAKSSLIVKMNPINDVVCNLLETPFRRWTDEDKRNVLLQGRPTGILDLSLKKDFKKSGRSCNVNFKPSWYAEYNWLCSSTALQKLFCWPCLLFSNKLGIWSRDGFTNFLNITRSLRTHRDSGEHLKCQLMLRNFERNQNTIADALEENARLHKLNFNEEVRLNRLCLRVVIQAVLYLTKQELPFRGHDEKVASMNRDNFKELLNMLIEISPLETKSRYEKIKNVFSGESKMIQNELIDCIASYITDHIKDDIKNSQFFSLRIDDITDITQTSQSSIIIRYVNSKGLLVERFLGFYDVRAGRTADYLFTMATTVLESFEYQHKLVGQCYDGASVMSEQLNGLQRKIKEHAPQAVFVYCLAHRLSFVLRKSFKNISKCRIFFASVTGISSFFHSSATSSRHMPTITETRWSSNPELLGVIVQDWDKLKDVFENIVTSEESDDKSVRLANGFLKNMNDFEFTFLAVVFSDIFNVTDSLYDVLQKKSLDINFCIARIKITRQLLSDKRNEEFFKLIFDKVSTITEIDTSERCNGLMRDAIITKYRALFFEILDHILMEMDIRFQDCDKLKFVCLADITKFEVYSLSFPTDAFENLLEFYGTRFTKHQRLKNELSLIYADENYRNINLHELVIRLQGYKDIFIEAFTLFCLILTIPSTSVSVERTFSCLKRLKTFTSNTILQDRLSSLAVISVNKEFLLELMAQNPFYEDIIDTFASLKDRGIELLYKK